MICGQCELNYLLQHRVLKLMNPQHNLQHHFIISYQISTEKKILNFHVEYWMESGNLWDQFEIKLNTQKNTINN